MSGAEVRRTTVLVSGPALAGATRVAAILRARLHGCSVVESGASARGQQPDVVVFVVSAAAPLSDCDAELLEAVAADTDAVVGAVTKIDLHRTWRQVLAADRAALCRRSARYRGVVWVGVAAEPVTGPPRVGSLVDAVRAALVRERRLQRNRLRSEESALRRRIADGERQAAVHGRRRVDAARTIALRAQLQQVRVQLAGQARAACMALRAELQQDAAGASRRSLGSFEDRAHRLVRQVADDFEQVLTGRLADLGEGGRLATAARPAPPRPPLEAYLPRLRRPRLENRLSTLLSAGFGLGVALTVGRLLADLLPGAAPAVPLGCGAIGVVLTVWVVRTRRLLVERSAVDRWALETVAGLRSALEERVLAVVLGVESALTAAGLGDRPGAGESGPAVPALRRALAAVRAELGEAVGPDSDEALPPLRHTPN